MVAVVVINSSKSSKSKITETNTESNTETVKNIEANTIKNNLILQQPKINNTYTVTDLNQPKNKKQYKSCKCCECYYKDTLDSRCCGLCFYCGDYIYCENKGECCYNCITSDLDKNNIWCFKNPIDYFNSGCFLTSSGYGNSPDCFCTVFAGIILCKFALTTPWLLCSMFNGTINCICNTNKNYLC